MFTLDDNIMRQLRATFKVEADEHIQAMNHALLALETGVAQEERNKLLEEIFREAHSLKGAAGAADLDQVEATAHHLESVFFATKNGEVELSPDLCDVLYDAIDSIAIIIQASLSDTPHGVNIPELHARLEGAKEGKVIPASAPQPSPGEPEMEAEEESDNDKETPPPAFSISPEEALPPVLENNKTESDVKTSPVPKTNSRANSGQPAEETIRVTTNKLDALMTQTGELMVAGLKIDQRLREVEKINHVIETWHREWMKVRSCYHRLLHEGKNEELRPFLHFLDLNQQNLKALAAQVADLRRGFSSDALHLNRVTDELGEGVMKVRMLPVSTVFDAFPRMVRDLARERGKKIDLQVNGGETELDRKVLEEIKDPLIHILRNAVDHGIETTELRELAGKPAKGTIRLQAFQKGSSIVIEVIDDGAGIDVNKVKKAALKAGIISAEEAEMMSDDEARRLIFASGVSTSATLTDISGRGVGMDVVRKNVEALHGQVDLESTLGLGTTIALTLPLTLATTQELLVQVTDQTYGIPISAVERILRVQKKDIKTVEGKEAILVDNEPVSLVNLADVLELEEIEEEDKSNLKMPVVILGSARWRIGFLVKAVVGQQESVVKSLGKQLSRVRNVAGASILGSGKVIMTLNPSDLMKSARGVKRGSSIAERLGQIDVKEIERSTIMVVDDSLTTRNLEKTILETAGYNVLVATDGAEALNLLESNGKCDIVVSDVAMPRMNGFELTQAIRKHPRLKETPVILITSLDSREDKERGIEVGADAYIIKSNFDQADFIQTIKQLT